MKTIPDDESRELPTSEPHRADTTRRWTGVGLISVAAASTLGWLYLAASHLHDRYGALHVQGAWMALARYANEGVLYPPLYDGQRYGGTRWMPLPIIARSTKPV